jgi:hypothetical protein
MILSPNATDARCRESVQTTPHEGGVWIAEWQHADLGGNSQWEYDRRYVVSHWRKPNRLPGFGDLHDDEDLDAAQGCIAIWVGVLIMTAQQARSEALFYYFRLGR